MGRLKAIKLGFTPAGSAGVIRCLEGHFFEGRLHIPVHASAQHAGGVAGKKGLKKSPGS
jgi:hypothetical protein